MKNLSLIFLLEKMVIVMIDIYVGREMRESVKIIRQAIKDLPTGQVMTSNHELALLNDDMKKNMESN